MAPEAADLAYSLTLAGAMAGSGLAWALFALGRGGGPLRRWSRWLLAVTAALIGVSFAVHLVFGHPPGSERALGPLAFAGEHRGMFVVLGAVLAGGWVFGRPEPAGRVGE